MSLAQFMRDHYKESCELILRFKDHKEILVRRSVITLIPAMGAYDPIAFQELFLSRAMSHLLVQVVKSSDRDACASSAEKGSALL